MSDFTLYDGLTELQESEAMKQGALDRYGAFNIRYIRFNKAEGKKWKKQVNAEGKEYSSIIEITKAQAEALTKSGGEVGSQYVFELNAEELGGKFNYQRGVSPKSPDMKLTVIPSVRKLMADDSADLEKVLQFLASHIGHYAHIEEVPEVDYDGAQKAGEGEKVYRAPRLVEFYADKAACQAAFTARWGKADSANGAQSSIIYPPVGTFTKSQWDEQIPLIKRLLVEGGYTPEQIAGDPNVQIPNAKTRLKLRAEVWGFGVPVECIASLIEDTIPA